MVKKVKKVKKFRGYTPQLRSGHPSHQVLRTSLEKKPYRSVIRLGSTTVLGDETSSGGSRVEINTANSIKNSADKLKMKECFTKANIKTAPWKKGTEADEMKEFPLIIKSRFGSRGVGNTYIENQQEFNRFLANHDMKDYIVEKYMNYLNEYRLHVTEENCFYRIQKKLKRDTDPKEKFQRHDSNSVWLLDTNPGFVLPKNWKQIEEECIKALKSLGLTIGAIDVRVQAKSKGDPDYFILESGSAPAFAEITTQKYINQLNLTLDKEAKKQGVIK